MSAPREAFHQEQGPEEVGKARGQAVALPTLVIPFTRPPQALSFTNVPVEAYHDSRAALPARSRAPVPVSLALTTIEFSRDARSTGEGLEEERDTKCQSRLAP